MARYKAGHRDESRKRILEAVGRGFRTGGYGGAGVDGLAKAAGVTSGAFYGHFRSKSDAFSAAIEAGMEQLRAGVDGFRHEAGAAWLERFVAFYLGPKRHCDLAEACALPTLTPEVARADPEIRQVYGAALERVLGSVAEGLAGGTETERRDSAIALLALLAGGVTMARAVGDPDLAEGIAAAIGRAAATLVEPCGANREDPGAARPPSEPSPPR